MNKKREFACNKLFNFCFIIGVFLLWEAIGALIEGDPEYTGLAWGMLAVSLLFIIIPAVFTPVFYAFDKEGVSLCYLFFPAERYLWKDISSVEVTDSADDIDDGKLYVFTMFFNRVFHLEGKPVGNIKPFMKGNIRKSFRTKRLIEKYWDGQITGFFFEGISGWFSKKRRKKQKQIEQHLTDEIVPMEREVRAKARELIKPYIGQAKSYGLELKAEYVYVTKDGEELNSRPDEGYTYTFAAEIARPNEKDEERIICVDIELLYVRLGKTAYRGVERECIAEDIQSEFDTLFEEIAQHGIDAYLEIV